MEEYPGFAAEVAELLRTVEEHANRPVEQTLEPAGGADEDEGSDRQIDREIHCYAKLVSNENVEWSRDLRVRGLIEGEQVPPAVFGSSTVRTADNAESDPVDCTVYAPPSATAGSMILVQVFAHTPEQAETVRATAVECDEESRRLGFQSLELDLVRGTALTIELTLPGLEVDEPVARLTWRGRPGAVQFGVSVPETHPARTVIGKVMVYVEDIPVGRILFKLRVVAAAENILPQPLGDQTRRYQTAFISYASADREEVLKRVQMLERCQIRYFQDILHLEPGARWEKELYRHIDQCDLFLLFWSSAAKQSEWVAKEVGYALARKCGDDSAPPEVVPVLIEGPPVPAPPPSLAHLHFNDQLLYFLSASRPAVE